MVNQEVKLQQIKNDRAKNEQIAKTQVQEILAVLYQLLNTSLAIASVTTASVFGGAGIGYLIGLNVPAAIICDRPTFWCYHFRIGTKRVVYPPSPSQKN